MFIDNAFEPCCDASRMLVVGERFRWSSASAHLCVAVARVSVAGGLFHVRANAYGTFWTCVTMRVMSGVCPAQAVHGGGHQGHDADHPHGHRDPDEGSCTGIWSVLLFTLAVNNCYHRQRVRAVLGCVPDAARPAASRTVHVATP